MLSAAAKSLLSHTPVDRVYFLTEDDAFPDKLPSFFTVINVSGQKYFPQNGPNIHNYYTYMTTMRAALSKVLPNEDRVLLLDPDTIVEDDITPIWATDLSYAYFAAVQETRNNDHMPPYYNAGVMLMNLAKLREDGMDDRIIAEINARWYKHLEQDVLNFMCKPFIVSLPAEYNASFVSDPVTHPLITHYLDRAKRDLPKAQEKYKDIPWNELKFVKGVNKND